MSRKSAYTQVSLSVFYLALVMIAYSMAASTAGIE
jgi:hypothetical protein